jgi:hypothetical protein
MWLNRIGGDETPAAWRCSARTSTSTPERGCRRVRPRCVIDLPPSASPLPRRRHRARRRPQHHPADQTPPETHDPPTTVARTTAGSQIRRVVPCAAVLRTDDVIDLDLDRVHRATRPTDLTQPTVPLEHHQTHPTPRDIRRPKPSHNTTIRTGSGFPRNHHLKTIRDR